MSTDVTTPRILLVAVLAAAAITGHAAAFASTAAAAPRAAKPAKAAKVTGKYADVNGLRMYYEVHGTGRPLVLLHGAFCTIEGCFGAVLPALSADRQVIAVELQGHGHTADIDRPLSTAQMADDTAALLGQLGITNADVLGYSMGSGVAIQLALRHPKVVGKLVLASVATERAGMHPGVLEMIDTITPEAFEQTPIKAAYLKAAPRPGDFPRLVEKIKQYNRGFTDIPAKTIRTIQAPTLIIVADGDIMKLEHAVELLRNLGGGVAGDFGTAARSQLAVVPGANHYGLMAHFPALVPSIKAFLDAKR
ncbi:MAG TPA: alpha/beta hydrolase [Kofleriaceae bacterium]|nr:alpha/beta hydrolase [Kofleriaceae bacterium]